jgi:hypothetical protein
MRKEAIFMLYSVRDTIERTLFLVFVFPFMLIWLLIETIFFPTISEEEMRELFRREDTD